MEGILREFDLKTILECVHIQTSRPRKCVNKDIANAGYNLSYDFIPTYIQYTYFYFITRIHMRKIVS